jgi:hypothetical protein
MGNQTSQNQNISSLASEVDDIAMNYILTQNTIDLLRLTDKEYYDNLIILTSSVIEKKFNGLELGFLQQRIFGKQSEAIDIIPASNKMKDKVVFDVSKFYIKIFMIYSAIATTIDPQYSYEKDGVKKTFYLKEMQEYKNIPKNVTPMLVNLTNPMNLCRKRLSILKNKLDPMYDDNQVKLNPGEQLCSISATTSLTDEVGIKELDLLYFDIFDYETKTWSKRSAKMKQKYNKDLTLFYQIFTGKLEMPESITSFNDIELLDLSTIDHCARDSFKKDLIVSNKNELVLLYLEKIKLIEKSTAIYRSKLVNLLRELFVVEIKDNNKKRILNPKLTMEHILIIETDTRDNILNLYTSCEKYFIQALIIFEKIYDEQVKKLNENRIDFIDEQMAEPIIEPDFHTQSYLSNIPTTTTLTAYTPYSSMNSDQTATFPGLREGNKNNTPIAPVLVPFTHEIVQPTQRPISQPANIDSFIPQTPFVKQESTQPPSFTSYSPQTAFIKQEPTQPPSFTSYSPQTAFIKPESTQSAMNQEPMQPASFTSYSPQTPFVKSEPMQNPESTQTQPIQTQPVQSPAPIQTQPTQSPEPSQTLLTTQTPIQTQPVQSPVPIQTQPIQSPVPSQSPEPSQTLLTTPSPELTQSPEPTQTPQPIQTLAPSQTPETIQTPAPTQSPELTQSPEPTQTPQPIQSPELTQTLAPSQTLEPIQTPAPTQSPEATQPQMNNPTKPQLNTVPTETPSENTKPTLNTGVGESELPKTTPDKEKSSTFMSFLLGKNESDEIKKDQPVASNLPTNGTNKIKLKPL